jgi:hypothetical protein
VLQEFADPAAAGSDRLREQAELLNAVRLPE